MCVLKVEDGGEKGFELLCRPVRQIDDLVCGQGGPSCPANLKRGGKLTLLFVMYAVPVSLRILKGSAAAWSCWGIARSSATRDRDVCRILSLGMGTMLPSWDSITQLFASSDESLSTWAF